MACRECCPRSAAIRPPRLYLARKPVGLESGGWYKSVGHGIRHIRTRHRLKGSAMQSIAVFKSESWERVPDDAERVHKGEPLGGDCARRIVERLASKGLSTRGPIAGELSWFTYSAVGRYECQLVIHWATPGSHDEDFWVVESSVRVSMVHRLFNCQAGKTEFESFLKVLREILLAESQVGNVRDVTWMTEEDYLSYYAS